VSLPAAAASAAQLQDVFFGDGRVAVRFADHAAVGAVPCESATDSRVSVLRELSGYRSACFTLRQQRSILAWPSISWATRSATGVAYISPSSSAHFLSRASRLLAVSSREIAHMQAAKCGHQMSTKFWEVITCFTTRPRAVSTCPAFCSSNSN
jgi:hypothetical protein